MGKKEILRSLNEQQRLPVIDYHGPSIVIAAAGSGKTHMLVSRASYMIEDGIDPRNILLFTFTKKAAEEIRERIIRYIGERGRKITVGTYHSFCARFLRRHIDVLGVWQKNFSIYDAEDAEKALKTAIKAVGEEEKAPTAYFEKKIAGWKERMKSPADAEKEAAGEDDTLSVAAARVYHQYAEMLRTQNALDFDDLIYITIRIFERFPSILEETNKRYQFICADESQDSSPRDLELIYYLGGTDMNICLVGDDCQSIYSFRGSDIETFFLFVKELRLKKFFLDQNYRSTKTIVEAANSVVKNNKDQFEKDVFTENEQGKPLIFYELPDGNSEAMRVVQIVKALEKKGIARNDIAVLYRVSHLSRAIEDAFLANAIPYRMLSGTPFYARKEIKDLMAYLRFLLNPNDQIALERALRTPKKGIGDTSIAALFSCIYGASCDTITIEKIFELKKTGLRGKGKKGFEHFLAVMQELKDAERQGAAPVELLEKTIFLTQYLSFLKKESKEEFDERKKNIEELCRLASEYESLNDFVGNMVVNETDCEAQKELDSINMLTIHGSKGLEFKAVIVIGCNQGTLPHFKSIEDGDIQEERRLFYVAMTRAKELLFLTRSKTQRMRNGGVLPQSRSAFLAEINSEYLRQA